MGSLIRATISSYAESFTQNPLHFQCDSTTTSIVILGKQTGDWKVPLSSLGNPHAWFIFKQHQWFVQEIDVLQGTYIRIRNRCLLESGCFLRIGRQYWQPLCEPSTYVPTLIDGTQPWQSALTSPSQFRLVQHLGPQQLGSVFCSTSSSLTLGQHSSDINIPGDDFLSSPHVRITKEKEGFVLEDLNSSQGTYIRLQSPHPLRHKDTLLMGQHLLQIELESSTLEGL